MIEFGFFPMTFARSGRVSGWDFMGFRAQLGGQLFSDDVQSVDSSRLYHDQILCVLARVSTKCSRI